jgi:hypothetical protein
MRKRGWVAMYSYVGAEGPEPSEFTAALRPPSHNRRVLSTRSSSRSERGAVLTSVVEE